MSKFYFFFFAIWVSKVNAPYPSKIKERNLAMAEMVWTMQLANRKEEVQTKYFSFCNNKVMWGISFCKTNYLYSKMFYEISYPKPCCSIFTWSPDYNDVIIWMGCTHCLPTESQLLCFTQLDCVLLTGASRVICQTRREQTRVQVPTQSWRALNNHGPISLLNLLHRTVVKRTKNCESKLCKESWVPWRAHGIQWW